MYIFLKYTIHFCGFLRNRSQFRVFIVIFMLRASKLIRNDYCYFRSITSVKICFKCYTTYRGREHVKKQKSVSRTDGDAEGLNILKKWNAK